MGYHSTNYYAIDLNMGKLLVDCGWPDTLPQFSAEFRRKGVALSAIRYVLATHFHPDHAGLVENFKKLGANLILMESQLGALQLPETLAASKVPSFIKVSGQHNIPVRFTESRAFLASLGLEGEIIPTPGHSEDSITLILDDGSAFTGDLPPRFMVADEDAVTRKSWDTIYRHNVTRIYPAHGN